MKKYDHQSETRDDAAMSFKEIGRRMGITRGGAWMLYKSAIRKLRARPVVLKRLRELADLKTVRPS